MLAEENKVLSIKILKKPIPRLELGIKFIGKIIFKIFECIEGIVFTTPPRIQIEPGRFKEANPGYRGNLHERLKM